MKKDAYFFPHFCNARHDRKLRRVQKELGVEGYGIFFMTLEVLREQTDFRYPISDLDLLADEFGTSEQKLRAVVCNYGLFEVDHDEKFISPKLVFYLQPYIEKTKRARNAANIRWNEIKNIDANAMQMHSKCNASAMQGEEGEKGEEGEEGEDKVPSSSAPTDDACPHNEIVSIYHDVLFMLAPVRSWGEQSRRNLRTRWKESRDRQNVEWWRSFFEYIAKSDFLTGRKTDFKASLPWIVGPKNFEKIINGQYENRGPNTGSKRTDSNIMTTLSWADRKKMELENGHK